MVLPGHRIVEHNPVALLGDEQFGVTDNVEKENMRDFPLDLLLNFSNTVNRFAAGSAANFLGRRPFSQMVPESKAILAGQIAVNFWLVSRSSAHTKLSLLTVVCLLNTQLRNQLVRFLAELMQKSRPLSQDVRISSIFFAKLFGVRIVEERPALSQVRSN